MQATGCCAIVSFVAVTRTIELRTEIPGPQSTAILERKERVVAEPALDLPARSWSSEAQRRDAHRRRRQHVHRLHRRRRLPQRRPLAPAGRRGGAGAARALRAHRLHDRPLRGLRRRSPSVCCELAPISRADEGRVLQRRHRGGRERGQVRARVHQAPGRDRLRGRVPRADAALADADLEDASVQGRPRPVRARGLPRAVPERLPRPRRGRRRSRRSSARSSTQVAAETVAAIVIEPVQGEGGFVVAPPEFVEGVRRICDEHGIVLVVDEVQTGFGRTGRMFAIEHYDVEPDLITIAKSIAAGLPLSGVLGRAEIMDAPGDCGDRRHLRRQPRRAGGRARRPRRDRGGGPDRARRGDRRDDPRADARAGRSASTRSATSAGSARCSRSSSSTTARRRTRRPSSRARSSSRRAERGLLLLKSGIYSNCIRVLVPLVITDAELDEALDVWEEALDASLGRSPGHAGHRLSVVVGELIADRYELEELVGTGGMSSVYRAHDTLLERDVALKVLHEQLHGATTTTSSASGARRARSRSSRTRTSSP